MRPAIRSTNTQPSSRSNQEREIIWNANSRDWIARSEASLYHFASHTCESGRLIHETKAKVETAVLEPYTQPITWTQRRRSRDGTTRSRIRSVKDGPGSRDLTLASAPPSEANIARYDSASSAQVAQPSRCSAKARARSGASSP